MYKHISIFHLALWFPPLVLWLWVCLVWHAKSSPIQGVPLLCVLRARFQAPWSGLNMDETLLKEAACKSEVHFVILCLCILSIHLLGMKFVFLSCSLCFTHRIHPSSNHLSIDEGHYLFFDTSLHFIIIGNVLCWGSKGLNIWNR